MTAPFKYSLFHTKTKTKRKEIKTKILTNKIFPSRCMGNTRSNGIVTAESTDFRTNLLVPDGTKYERNRNFAKIKKRMLWLVF